MALVARILKRLDDGWHLVEITRKKKAIEVMKHYSNYVSSSLESNWKTFPGKAINLFKNICPVLLLGSDVESDADSDNDEDDEEDNEDSESDSDEDKDAEFDADFEGRVDADTTVAKIAAIKKNQKAFNAKNPQETW